METTTTTLRSSTPDGKSKTKLARKFHKAIHLNTAAKFPEESANRTAVLEALIAKMFAEVTSIKAAYAELQTAQNPYDEETIQSADHDLVEELKTLSHLKRSFLRNELDLISPQVTAMLAEIQEQQSLIKTYKIMIKKLEDESKTKSSELASMKNVLDDCVSMNRSIETKLNASGNQSDFELSDLNPSHFVRCLHYAMRSVRSFAKLMVRGMESARWDLDLAAAAIEPELPFLISILNRCFVFESYVAKTMLEGCFDFDSNSNSNSTRCEEFFGEFKKMKSANLRKYLAKNPSSSFADFIRTKYTLLMHAKMECSLFGSLSQRKAVIGGAFPDTEFFGQFAEMARRVWALNLLAMSFGGESLHVFQVRKNCRFSEVYMESVSDEYGGNGRGGDLRVGLTVFPGFKIGKTVIQSQVYLTPATADKSPVRR